MQAVEQTIPSLQLPLQLLHLIRMRQLLHQALLLLPLAQVRSLKRRRAVEAEAGSCRAFGQRSRQSLTPNQPNSNQLTQPLLLQQLMVRMTRLQQQLQQSHLARVTRMTFSSASDAESGSDEPSSNLRTRTQRLLICLLHELAVARAENLHVLAQLQEVLGKAAEDWTARE